MAVIKISLFLVIEDDNQVGPPYRPLVPPLCAPPPCLPSPHTPLLNFKDRINRGLTR